MEPDHIRYEPSTGDGHDFLYTQVSFTPLPQRGHILHAVKEQRAGDNWLRDEPWELQDCISVAATRHLQGQTGMHTYITGHDGDTARVVTLIPAPSLERKPRDDAQPYLRPSQLRPLTDNQLGLIPELTARLRQIVPGNLQRHIEDLARKVAQDIPARADLLRAYQRTSVTEVLAEYDARTTGPSGIDNAPASVKTARLTFPEQPGSAVTGTALERPARPHTGPAFGALTAPGPEQGFSR
jgi:hypothetical protein